MSDVKETYLFGIPYLELPKYRAKKPIGTAPIHEAEKINYDLLDEIMSFIREHPTSWVQDSWYRNVDTKTGESIILIRTEEVEDANSCGTSFCFAGHTAIHEGFPYPPKNDRLEWERKVIEDDGYEYHEDVRDFAMKVLGLDYDQADSLFDADNSMDNLEVMVQALHEFPNIRGWRMDDIRKEDLSIEDVRAGVSENPSRWLYEKDN
jgi:hypothetical protein